MWNRAKRNGRKETKQRKWITQEHRENKKGRLYLPCDVSVNEVVGHRRPSGDDVAAAVRVGWALSEGQSLLIVEHVLKSLG